MAIPRRLVLGSTSRYRAELLDRLGLAFEQRPPGTLETELAEEARAARPRVEPRQSGSFAEASAF